MDNIFDYYDGLQYKDENFDFTNARTTAGALPDLALVNGTSIEVPIFDGVNTTEGVSITKELNHDYAEGTLLYFHVHWMPTTTVTSGNVRWNLDYYVAHPDTPNTVISGTLYVVSTASGIAWQSKLTHFDALDLGALGKIGAQVSFRFYRNPALSDDTYGTDAAVATMGWHYKTNSRGSASISTK